MQSFKHTNVLHAPHNTADGEYADGEVVSEQQVVRPSSASRLQQIVYTVYGIVASLLLIRFIFALFSANPLNAIAHFIYSITSPLIGPFRTLFVSGVTSYKSSRFEAYTLVAVAVYGLLAWLIIRLLGINKDAARRDPDM